MMDFDTLRAKYPHLSYMVSAYDPGGPVTLECITADGKSFKFTGPTMLAAIEDGFPEDPEPTDIGVPITTDVGSVFD